MEWSSAAKHFVGNSSLGMFDHFVGSGLRRLGCKHWDPLFLLLLSRLFCTFSAGRGGGAGIQSRAGLLRAAPREGFDFHF